MVCEPEQMQWNLHLGCSQLRQHHDQSEHEDSSAKILLIRDCTIDVANPEFFQEVRGEQVIDALIILAHSALRWTRA